MTNVETNDKAAVAEQGAPVAPKKATSKKGASPKKDAPKAKKSAKAAKKQAAKPEPAAKTTAARAESKGAKILEMISRAKGATLAEIMKATNWQAHSVRGFISTAGKKHKIESSKNESGDRLYHLLGK